MDADERLGIAVNVIGDPAAPTLVDVEINTDNFAAFVVK
jgi:hypothetical protein